jgi:hypothetical protein
MRLMLCIGVGRGTGFREVEWEMRLGGQEWF